MKINSKQLIYYAIKYEGNYNKILKAIHNEEEYKIINSINAITILDLDYPKCFLELEKPPIVLFYKGDISLLKSDMVAIIGSRNVCEYAKNETINLTNELKKKYTIVSGLAKGIDSIAHNSALDFKTIGILGCGIDYIYPYENKELFKKMSHNHLIISEYPSFTKPLRYHFPFRNRLIAALSSKIFVMQAGIHSGTLITVNEALNLNKDVYALPYNIDMIEGIGTNYLIEEGANLIIRDNYQLY